MAFPLLLLPLIGAALGTGTQAARGKTGNKDLWKGALIGASLGAGGAAGGALAGGSLLGSAAGTGAGMTAVPVAGAPGAMMAAGSSATNTATGAGGFNALLGAAGKGAATAAGSSLAARALTPQQEMIAERYGYIPPMQQQQDPMELFRQLQTLRRIS
jgi:hypothetical protein